MTETPIIPTEPLPANLLRLRGPALLAGIVGLVVCAIGWLAASPAFYRAYLFAYFFFLGITLGALSWVMMHHLVGGGWGRAIQRIGEAAALNTILMAVLFIPIAVGVKQLYPWARPELVAKDVGLQHKAPYLNFSFWLIRAIVYFAIWITFALLMVRGSTKFDRTRSPTVARRMRRVSAAGLVIYVLTLTFAGVDW